MCGLAGMAGFGIVGVDCDVYRDILYMSAMRGPHSTGLASLNSSDDHDRKNPRIVKRVGPSHYFLMMDAADKNPQIKSSSTDVYIGHCRWSTVGKTNEANAHPFDTGRFVAAHNGTLYDTWSYAPKGSDKTDSQLMFEKMETEGIVEVLSSLRKTSAYAISMYDKRNNRVILARNIERPLYVAIAEKRDVIFWASEYGILWAAAARNKVAVKIIDLTPDQIYWVDPAKIKKGKEVWGVTKLNPKPTETSTSKTRSHPDDKNKIDWEGWQAWQDQMDAASTSVLINPENDKTLSIGPINKTAQTGGPPWDDDMDDVFNVNHDAANRSSVQKPEFIDLTSRGKNYTMTNEELEQYEMARANSTTSVPVIPRVTRIFTDEELAKASAHHSGKPKGKSKKNKRRENISLVDKLFDEKIQTIDDIMLEIAQDKLKEQEEKIQRDLDKIDLIELNETPECCVCRRELKRGSHDFMTADAVNVEGTFYYSCKVCNDDLERIRAQGR